MSYKGEGVASQSRLGPGSASQTISGSGNWDGISGMIYVTGTGPRSVHLGQTPDTPSTITILDLDGTSESGKIQIVAETSTINGEEEYILQNSFSSVTLTLRSSDSTNNNWVILSETPTRPRGVSRHGMLEGLDEDDHLQYLLTDGTRSMRGDLRLGTSGVPSSGYLRVSRRSQDSFDILTSTLVDGETCRALISAFKNNFRLHTSVRSPLVVWGDSLDAPLRFTSGGNSVDTGIRGASCSVFAVSSTNAAIVSTHQYGPTATAGTALNLSYRAARITTVVGIGTLNASDHIKVLTKGLSSDGTTFIHTGVNSVNKTVWSVDDLGRSVVGTPSKGSHAVNRDFLAWVPTKSNSDSTLTRTPGQVNFHEVDASLGPCTVYLAATPASGDRIVLKDNGSAGTHKITVHGNGHMIDGESTKDISTNYGSLALYFNGIVWLVT